MDLQFICPDCKNKLQKHDHQLKCLSCGWATQLNKSYINLLPALLSASEVAEDAYWRDDPRQGLKVHPLISLLVSKEPILLFYEQILPQLKLTGRVLEIGCGTCWLSSLIKNNFPGVNTVASDVSPNALFKSAETAKFMNVNIDCLVACKAEELPFEDSYFDYIVGCAILHHTNPQKTIHEIHRVLKSEGEYIGFGELAIPRILDAIWGSVGLAGQRASRLNLKEAGYSYNKWQEFFLQAGFGKVVLTLDKNPEYKLHWFIHLYYKLFSRLPDGFIKRFIASSIIIKAIK